MYTISKRGLIRTASFCLAVVLSLSLLLYINCMKANNAKQQLQYNYMRAMEDLSLSLDSIKNSLNKGMYSNSPEMMSELAGKLWSDASIAKLSLSGLPVEELNLSNTYKFLSQVGNYSKSLSRKFSDGNEFTADDKENIVKLYDYAKSVSDNIWNVESQLQGGYLTFDKIALLANESVESRITETAPANITDGFKDIEGGFHDYPALIYDGPFSDHIMQKEPEMLKNKPETDKSAAYRIAAQTSGISGLEFVTEERGKMPSFVFKAGNATVAVTKAGGMFSYMLDYREIKSAQISIEMAIDAAEKYLGKLGLDEMTNTYYETKQGVCIINFAAVQEGITLYTDLIKIGVALDDGEIISFDGRGYLSNHMIRDLKPPVLSVKEASMNISPYLKAERSKLCVIPSEGLSEKYCYEFVCRNSSGQQILVYINAENGKEEQILLLQISENGMLTV